MSDINSEKILILIRSLIALSVGMVVAMLVLALAFWVQAEWLEVTEADTTASIISFLLPFLFGGLAAGLASWTWRRRFGLAHGLGFSALYLAMFIWGWIRSDEIGALLIVGLVFAGFALGGLGGIAGVWLRKLFRRRRE